MTILVTGASGTVGARLVDEMVAGGRTPRVASRHPAKLRERWPQLDAVELDVLRPATIEPALEDVTAAYYLVHSMEPAAEGGFRERDADGARFFGEAARGAGVERVIYLGGLGEDDEELSEHLESRHETGRILAEAGPPLLEFRRGDGGEQRQRIVHDALRSREPAAGDDGADGGSTRPRSRSRSTTCCRISSRASTRRSTVTARSSRSAGPTSPRTAASIETVAAERGRHPVIVGVPLLSPRLSSYRCGLTTSVSPSLARPLIEGMTTPMVVHGNEAGRRFPGIEPMPFVEALRRAQSDDREPGRACAIRRPWTGLSSGDMVALCRPGSLADVGSADHLGASGGTAASRARRRGRRTLRHEGTLRGDRRRRGSRPVVVARAGRDRSDRGVAHDRAPCGRGFGLAPRHGRRARRRGLRAGRQAGARSSRPNMT